jgi:hypothetical protein
VKILRHFDQGSDEWLAQRCGKVTMSHAKDLLTGGKGKTRQSYILDLVAERLSGKPTDNFLSVDMQRGTFLEEYAVAAFESSIRDNSVTRVGFVLTEDERIGCSPDGLIGSSGGIEIKCPAPRQHIRNVLADGMDDYIQQVQGNLWVCERDRWFIVSFCPWVEDFPLHIKLVYRDEDMIKKISESAIRAADEVDAMVNAPVNKYGKRVAEIAQDAKEAWESMQAGNDEVVL